MKFPENSPYNSGKGKEFKPNQNRKEMILNAKKAEFQSQLMGSSFRFTMDGKSPVDNREKAREYIKPSEMQKQQRTWAETMNKESKNYLTQMQTLNSNAKTRSGSLKPIQGSGDSRFMTVSDSYFN